MVLFWKESIDMLCSRRGFGNEIKQKKISFSLQRGNQEVSVFLDLFIPAKIPGDVFSLHFAPLFAVKLGSRMEEIKGKMLRGTSTPVERPYVAVQSPFFRPLICQPIERFCHGHRFRRCGKTVPDEPVLFFAERIGLSGDEERSAAFR